MAKITSRFRHYIAKLVVTRPAMVDRYVWLRMTPRAAELLNAKFDVKAPRQYRIAKDDYQWKRWDFFNAAKYFFNFKAETVVAIYTTWLKKPGFDPKFKPSVLMNLWLTIPEILSGGPPPKKEDFDDEEEYKRKKEAFDKKFKPFEDKINEVVNVIGESTPDLTADLLQNMSVTAAVKFLKTTGAPPVLMVLRKILPFDVTVKLFNALRQADEGRYKFWLQKFPVEDVAKVKMKLLEIDRMAIEEFRLKNEIMKYKHGELNHQKEEYQIETEPIKQEAERVRFENDKMKFEAMLDKRRKRQEGEDSIEEQQRERQANLEKSVAELAKTLTDVIKQYRQEEEEPAKPIQSAGDKGG